MNDTKFTLLYKSMDSIEELLLQVRILSIVYCKKWPLHDEFQ